MLQKMSQSKKNPFYSDPNGTIFLFSFVYQQELRYLAASGPSRSLCLKFWTITAVL